MITVAIPAYKREWLGEAIESVMAQTYTDFELLVVDDHSPYHLQEVVHPYLRDPRVRYFCNAENLGRKSIVHNWNRCLELAQGEYFVLLCDDDILLPQFLECLLALVKDYPSCQVFHANKYNLYQDHQEIVEPWPAFESYQNFLASKAAGFRYHTISEFLFNTNHIRSCGGFVPFPVGFFSDDASVLVLANNGGIASTTEPLFMFRVNDKHITSNPQYAYDRGVAAMQYYHWINSYFSHDTPFLQSQIERSSAIFYWSLQLVSKIDRVRLLLHPSCWMTIKQRLQVCYSLYLEHRNKQ